VSTDESENEYEYYSLMIIIICWLQCDIFSLDALHFTTMNQEYHTLYRIATGNWLFVNDTTSNASNSLHNTLQLFSGQQ
jgi:hypothetical protein